MSVTCQPSVFIKFHMTDALASEDARKGVRAVCTINTLLELQGGARVRFGAHVQPLPSLVQDQRAIRETGASRPTQEKKKRAHDERLTS